MEKIEIYVATHKPMEVKLPDFCKPIQVNTDKNGRWANYLHDNDTFDNISAKNNSYCELTALYAMWKGCDAEIQGLFHYRRYLSNENRVSLRNENYKRINKKKISEKIITKERISELLASADVILPMDQCPYPTTAYEDLQRFVSLEDIHKMVDIVQLYYPEYMQDMTDTLNSMNISYCNMFIARKEFVDFYCTWLFDVLEKVEMVTPVSTYDVQHQRIFGYYSEILINVFIKHHHYKVEKVYRVDLLEKSGGSVLRQKGNQFISNALVPIGIYPVRYSRSLWKARYLWLTDEKYQKRINDILCNAQNAEDLADYFKLAGGDNIHIIRGKRFDSVSANFVNVSLMYFICESDDSVLHVIKRVKKLRQKNIPFGEAWAYRVLLKDGVSNSHVDQLRKLDLISVG